MELSFVFVSLSAVGALLGVAISFSAFKMVFDKASSDEKPKVLILGAMLMPNIVYSLMVFIVMNMQLEMIEIPEQTLLYGTGVFGFASLLSGVLKGKNLQVGLPKFDFGSQQFLKMIVFNAVADSFAILGLIFVLLTLFNGDLPWNLI